MSSRDLILDRVRSALDGAPAAPPVDRAYRVAKSVDVDLFVERLEDYRAQVIRCSTGDVARTVAALVGVRRVVVADGLPWTLPTGLEGEPLTHDELDLVEGVVTTAAVGIAETGTIVLDHGPGQGRRALSLVPDLLVCVLRTNQIVAGVPDAIAALNPARPQTWISGPSATSDIELDRVEGVHGPRNLVVVLAAAT